MSGAVRAATRRDRDRALGLWLALLERHAPLDSHYPVQLSSGLEWRRLIDRENWSIAEEDGLPVFVREDVMSSVRTDMLEGVTRYTTQGVKGDVLVGRCERDGTRHSGVGERILEAPEG